MILSKTSLNPIEVVDFTTPYNLSRMFDVSRFSSYTISFHYAMHTVVISMADFQCQQKTMPLNVLWMQNNKSFNSRSSCILTTVIKCTRRQAIQFSLVNIMLQKSDEKNTL